MRYIQYTLNDEEFLLLRSVCVIKNTNMKIFTRDAVLECIKKYLSDNTNTHQILKLKGEVENG